jgi:hypothetical protein
MMKKMTGAKIRFNSRRRPAEVHPVVGYFISHESREQARERYRSGAKAKAEQTSYPDYKYRRPCSDREYRCRVAMMHIVKRGYECRENVGQKSVNGVFDNGPGN